jgi:hypothetical protein
MLQSQYTWEAVQKNGIVVSEGESLENAVKVSLIPGGGALPRHELVGQKFVRRFGRGFVQGMGGGLREYVQCVVCEDFRVYVLSSTGAIVVTPADYELYL